MIFRTIMNRFQLNYLPGVLKKILNLKIFFDRVGVSRQKNDQLIVVQCNFFTLQTDHVSLFIYEALPVYSLIHSLLYSILLIKYCYSYRVHLQLYQIILSGQSIWVIKPLHSRLLLLSKLWPAVKGFITHSQ